jgi:Arc/MetJ family transcription regulator
MTLIQVDIDDETIAKAQRALRTTSKKQTVAEAVNRMAESIDRAEARQAYYDSLTEEQIKALGEDQ